MKIITSVQKDDDHGWNWAGIGIGPFYVGC